MESKYSFVIVLRNVSHARWHTILVKKKGTEKVKVIEFIV